jgi:hypothetical protein
VICFSEALFWACIGSTWRSCQRKGMSHSQETNLANHSNVVCGTSRLNEKLDITRRSTPSVRMERNCIVFVFDIITVSFAVGVLLTRTTAAFNLIRFTQLVRVSCPPSSLNPGNTPTKALDGNSEDIERSWRLTSRGSTARFR